MSIYDDPAVSAGEIADYLYSLTHQPTNNMSEAEEQTRREYISDFLDKHGMPDEGTIHVVHQGDEENYENEPRDTLFHPDSAVVMLVPQGGQWLDGQCYDKYGYEVYAD